MAETLVKMRGYYLNNDILSSEFRRLAVYVVNTAAKKPVTDQRKLWKLEIDNFYKKEYTHEELVERNRKIRGE